MCRFIIILWDLFLFLELIKGLKIWYDFFFKFLKKGGGGCGFYWIWFFLIKLIGRKIYIYFFFLGWVLLIEFKYYICDMKYYYIMIFDK